MEILSSVATCWAVNPPLLSSLPRSAADRVIIGLAQGIRSSAGCSRERLRGRRVAVCRDHFAAQVSEVGFDAPEYHELNDRRTVRRGDRRSDHEAGQHFEDMTGRRAFASLELHEAPDAASEQLLIDGCRS